RRLPVRQALGTPALRAAGSGPAPLLDGRPLPSGLRRSPRATGADPRGLPPPRSHPARPRPPLAALLLGREAPDGRRPGAAPPPGRRGREPGRLRPSTPRPGGARTGRPAPRGRHLHGGPGRPVAGRNDAPFPGPRAGASQRDPRSAAG